MWERNYQVLFVPHTILRMYFISGYLYEGIMRYCSANSAIKTRIEASYVLNQIAHLKLHEERQYGNFNLIH